MEKDSKIFVAGHRGLVGSAILNNLRSKGYTNFLLRTHAELDLTDQAAVNEFFAAERPDCVFLSAAHVGGIMANSLYRADFIYNNLMIQNNVIHASWKNNVKKLLFLGSTCIYPREAPQPMPEDCLLTSPLIFQRALRDRQDSGYQDVRELQPAIRYELYRRDAYQPLRAE